MKHHTLHALAFLASASLSGVACKSSSPVPPTETLSPLPTEAGLPVRQFYVATPLKPGESIDSGEGFMLDGRSNGQLFVVGADAVRAKFVVKETDGAMHTVTPRSGAYVQPNLFHSPAMRALCATEVSVIDRGPAPTGHAYSYDTAKGSRLLCWVNPSSSAKDAWQEIEVASSMGSPDKDMFWSFAMTGSRTEPRFDVVYAADAEWTPQLFHSIGRLEREKGYERRLVVADGQAKLDVLFDGDFPDFTGLAARDLPGSNPCQFQCGWVWNGNGWNGCGECATGSACVAGHCEAGKTCTPKTPNQVCEALACGKFSDGCGGRIDCGEACPAGTACGADGTYRRCGKRLNPKTAEEVRASYGDKGRQLCGVMQDPATSTSVDLGACPDPDQRCQNNLCDPLRAAPADAGTD